MNRPKIMFISAANSIHTVRWVNALSETLEVHLVYCKDHKPDVDKIDNRVILHQLPFKAPWGYYLNAKKLKKIYNQIKPDVINAHYASGYGTLARFAKIKPILLSIWGSDVYDFPNKSKINKRILQKNIMYADNIASTSHIMAEELKKQVPMLSKKIFITPFGVDTERFKKKEITRNNSDFTIGNIKTLEEVYGIRYLILGTKQVIEKLNSNNEAELAKSIKLYIYGEGSQKQELEDLIKENNLEEQVFLMGKITNDLVPEKLNQLDVFCATSNKESFGVAIVEAMACEVPVIATDTDGFCEVMENNFTGYIVERKNVEQIAEAIEKILRNKEQRKIMGKNGRKRVLANYNWNDNVKNMINIYQICK